MSVSQNNEISLKATGTVAPCTFVTLDKNFDEQYVQSVGGDWPFGVMQEAQRGTPGLAGSDATIAAQSGDTGPRIVQWGNDCLLTLGGTVSPGNAIMPDSQGRGISCPVGQYYGAIALQAGTTGVKIRVVVQRGKA